MAVSGQDNSRTFVATGTAAPVAIAFPWAKASDLVVQRLVDGADSADDGEPETLNSSYSIGGNGRATPPGNPTGFLTEINLIAGRTYRIERKTALLQNYLPRMGIAGDASAQENQLDDIVMSQQDLSRVADMVMERALMLPRGQRSSLLPSLDNLRGRYLSVNADDEWYGADGLGADDTLRAELASDDPGKGGNLVSFFDDYLGEIHRRSVIAKLKEFRSVDDIPGTDDMERLERAMLKWPGQVVIVPYRSVSWALTRELVVPLNTILKCEDALFELAHDGCAIRLGHYAELHGARIESDGSIYPNSRGVRIAGTDGRQTMRDCKIDGTGLACIDFEATGAGSRFMAINSDLNRHGSAGMDSVLPVIKMADGALAGQAVPRGFVGTNTNGCATVSTGGCNDLFFSGGGYHGAFYFSEYSRGVKMTGIRVGNQSVMHIKGCNISITGCGLAPQPIIDAAVINPGVLGSGQSVTIAANDMNNPRVIDNSGFWNTNTIQHNKVTDASLTIRADGTALTVAGGNNRNGVYRNGQEYCLDIDIQGSWVGGAAVPGGLGSAASITFDVPSDYMPTYEQFVGPFDMTYNGAQRVAWGRLFGTTTGAGDVMRLGYFDGTGAFVQYTGAALNAGSGVTRIRGTARWTR